jgi:hypothetical protein
MSSNDSFSNATKTVVVTTTTTTGGTDNTTTTTSSNSNNETNQSNNSTTITTSKRRIRHTFRNNNTIDTIPSFRDFQQTIQIRTLYRQFIRLFKKTRHGTSSDNNNTNTTTNNDTTSTASKELKDQVRREFRQQHTDNWSIKKALSEGTRRYEDLSAMIGMPSTITLSDTTNDTNCDNNTEQLNDTKNNHKWPWDMSNTNNKIPPPLRFPKKS